MFILHEKAAPLFTQPTVPSGPYAILLPELTVRIRAADLSPRTIRIDGRATVDGEGNVTVKGAHGEVVLRPAEAA